MKSIYVLTIAIFIGFHVPVNPQDATTDPIARVGLKKITEEEYIKRYEYTPWLERQSKSKTQNAKLEFLYTIIAEKLWAQEAIQLGLDTTDVIQFSKSEFIKLFVRDALYKKEILEKIQISEQELMSGLNRYYTTLKVNFIFSENESEIYSMYTMLYKGVTFDSILSVRSELDEQNEPIDVVYGQMDDAIEDSLYNLNTNEYTAPIYTPDGWYIFRLTNRIETIMYSENDIEDSKKEVGRIIKARKSRILYSIFYKSFFSEKEIEVNPVLFNSLAEKISDRFEWEDKNNPNPEKSPFNLTTNDVIYIEEKFGADTLNMIFLNFESEPISLKNFIRILVFDGFSSDDYNILTVSTFLDNKTRTIIEHELLAREGIKRGYHLLPEVQTDLKMWIDNYLFQVLKNKFLDSVYVNDDEVYAFTKSTNDQQQKSTQTSYLTESKKDELKRKLIFQKANNKMNNYTVNLAIKYGIGIDLDLLDSIEVTNISSFGIRGLGFGGKLNAVPMLAPNIEWVKPWLNRLNVIQ